jgi:twitching motility two-component system response regulator PilG
LELFVRLDLFSWQAVEAFIQQKVVLIFEQLFPYLGSINLDKSIQYDLSYGEDCHGLSWAGIQHDLEQRQQGWASLAPAISTMFVMPQQIKEAQDHIPDAWVKQHLQQWGDGQTSLLTIAAKIDRDPLELAHSYLHWAKMGWISFNQQGAAVPLPGSTAPRRELPTILSVDDSPVVQTMIKRAIGDRYHVLMADNAVKALNLLNSQDIKLLLLDVTMPDIDGLELCRTIRRIGKFRNLPVIMLTAKDGMLNKIKSQMAGSTHYLTKPVDRDQLIEVLEKHVPTQAAAVAQSASMNPQHQSFSLSMSRP